MQEYEVVVYEYGFRRHYHANNKKEAIELYEKWSKERPGNVKIFKKKKQ